MTTKNNSTELKELAQNVLSYYEISPDNLTIIQNNGLKTLWKVTHNNQLKCLKRLKHTKDKALFTVNAQRHVFENGGKVPEVYLNNQGEPITEYMDQLFVLYEWIEGSDLFFNRPVDLSLALQGLSKFHVFSKGYQSPEGAKVSSKLGRWPEQYDSMMRRMMKWKEEAKLKPQHPSYKSYLQYIDSIIDLANQALDALNQSSYGVLTDIELSASTLCHQDYGEGNVIKSSGGIYVIDLDGVTYDLVIRDLRKIIGKRMEKGGNWNLNQIEAILKSYEKHNPLSLQEKEVLKADLLFPHWFFAKTKNMFKKNKPVKPSEITKIGELEAKKLLVLKEWL